MMKPKTALSNMSSRAETLKQYLKNLTRSQRVGLCQYALLIGCAILCLLAIVGSHTVAGIGCVACLAVAFILDSFHD